MQQTSVQAKLQSINCRSERLQLTALSEADKTLYFAVMADRACMQYVGSPLTYAEAQHSFGAALKLNLQPHIQRFFFSVTQLSDGQSVGIASVNYLNLAANQAEIGRMLLPQWHGKGLGTELSSLLINWLAKEIGIVTFIKQIRVDNKAAIYSALKLGFLKVKSQLELTTLMEQYQLNF